MAKYYDQIPAHLLEWILAQHIFWVATAALQPDGHVNISPKATPNSFHIDTPTRVWYEDLTGSGAETIAHIRQPGNARITLLFTAFHGPPRILRIWGKGTAHEFGTPEYDAFVPASARKAGSRAVIVVDVDKVGTSCGFGVPVYTFEAHRTTLEQWCGTMERYDAGTSQSPGDPRGIKAWWAAHNLTSLDGIPALQCAHLSPAAPISALDTHTPRPRKAGAPLQAIATLAIGFGLGVVVTAAYVRLAGRSR